MTVFIALLRKDPASDFGVDFPDFPGCVTAGSTVDEAVAMAREALGGHIVLRARPPGHTIVSRSERLNEGGASFGGR